MIQTDRIECLKERLKDHKREITSTTIDDILKPQIPEAPYKLPPKEYDTFKYYDKKKNRVQFASSYLLGGAWGMQNLYSGQVFLADRLKKNSILAERVRLHEMEEGHDFYRDEAITRIKSSTLDTSPFVVHDKYGT